MLNSKPYYQLIAQVLLCALITIGLINVVALTINQVAEISISEFMEGNEADESKEENEFKEEFKFAHLTDKFAFSSSLIMFSIDYGHKCGDLYIPNIPSPPPDLG